MNNKKLNINKFCIIAIMVAMFVILNTYISLNFGNLKITFASLPILFLVLYYQDYKEAIITVIIGEFLNQLLTYGITLTTPLWILAPTIRPIIFYLMLKLVKFEYRLNYNYIIFSGIVAALCTSCINTLVMYIDAIIYDYYTFAYIFGAMFSRIIIGIIAACIISPFAAYLVDSVNKYKG